MITEIVKYHNYRKKLAVITAGIFLVMIAIITVAKISMRSYSTKHVTAATSGTGLLLEKELNVPETKVLLSVSGWAGLAEASSEQGSTHQIIYNSLKAHYESPEVELSPESALDICELVSSRNDIVSLEKETQISRMSYDAREMVIHLLKRICEISGMKLMINDAGNIEKIVDGTGHIIYQEENPPIGVGFRLNAVIITLVLLVFLLIISIVISKKSQIMVVKGGDYDGIDEEEFA